MAVLTLILLLTVTSTVQSYVRICYYTNWSQYRNGPGKYFLAENYQDGLCTHIIFSFGKVEKSGEGYVIAPYEWNDQSRLYKELNEDLKSRDPNLKTLLAIGGWTHSSNGFTPMVETRESRKYFINAARMYLKEHGFDGLDLDWEFPGRRGGPAIDKKRFTYLCQELKEAFAPHGLLVTAAVSAGVNSAALSYEIPKIAQSLDFINLMTYDLHGSWETTTGHHTDTNPDRPIQTEHSLYNTVKHWISEGVPSNKLVLGLGTYGRTWKLQSACQWEIGSPAAGAGQSGPYTRENGFMAYYEICKLNFLNKVCTYSSPAYAPYGTTSTTFVGYDDPESIAHKVNNIVKAFGMYGYMFWALDLDDFRGDCGQGKYPLMNAAKYALEGMTDMIPRCYNKKTCPGTVSTMMPYKSTIMPYKPTMMPYKPTMMPYKTTMMPYKPTMMPYKPTMMPYKSTMMPYKSTMMPYKSTMMPYKSTMMPYKSTMMPYKSTMMPYKPTMMPYKPTMMPYKPTMMPYKPTMMPYKPTMMPYKPTMMPYKPTMMPYKPTMMPYKSTMMPYKPTMMPYKPTMMPYKPTMMPYKPNGMKCAFNSKWENKVPGMDEWCNQKLTCKAACTHCPNENVSLCQACVCMSSGDHP